MKTKNLKTITVAALMDLLEFQDPEALVIFSVDYGDHAHTKQALPLRGAVEEVKAEKSAYSNSGFAVVTDEDEQWDDEEGREPRQTYLLVG